MKMCPSCSIDQPLENFPQYFHLGIKRTRSLCRPCGNRKRGERQKRNPTATLDAQKRSYAKNSTRWNEITRSRRKDKKHRAGFIWIDSRKSDRKKGLVNDLTKEFIESKISQGCSYCGEQNLLMTLDRIDNAIGHTIANVVPACIRCNYMKRDMPHLAWMELVETIKSIKERGLFEEWTGRAR